MKHKLINSDIRENYIYNLLKDRGIENPNDFLNPTMDDIASPFQLDNISKGFELIRNLHNEDKVCLIVDCDCDGYCSAAMMYLFLKELYPDIEIEYLIHQGKSHGFEEHIDYLEDQCYNLIICVDAGSNDLVYTNRLFDTQILILDHHLVDQPIGENVVLINNQTSESYLNKDLCGGGVVWQFINGYDYHYGTNYASHYIDLAALSIIGDMMGMNVIENQAIVKEGLTHIQNKFFKALIEKQDYSLKGKINPTSIAFYIVPLINGMIRVGSQPEKERMFLAFINGDELVPCNKRGAKGTFERVAIESARECANAKAKQDREKEKAIASLEIKIFNNNLLDNQILFVRLDDEDDFPAELNGLIAMGLASKYKKPTIVARLNKEGYVRGSARGLNESELTSFKNFLTESGLMEYAQG